MIVPSALDTCVTDTSFVLGLNKRAYNGRQNGISGLAPYTEFGSWERVGVLQELIMNEVSAGAVLSRLTPGTLAAVEATLNELPRLTLVCLPSAIVRKVAA